MASRPPQVPSARAAAACTVRPPRPSLQRRQYIADNFKADITKSFGMATHPTEKEPAGAGARGLPTPQLGPRLVAGAGLAARRWYSLLGLTNACGTGAAPCAQTIPLLLTNIYKLHRAH